MKKKNGSNVEFYVPSENTRTRSGLHYTKVGSGQEELSGKPASVQVLEGAGVKLRCSGLPLTAKPEDPSDFRDYHARQGGTWMWEGLSEKHKHDDLTWLVEGLKKGTIEWWMGLITEAEHPMSVAQGGCVVTLLQWSPVKARKASKETFGRSLTVQILIEQNNWAFAPFTI